MGHTSPRPFAIFVATAAFLSASIFALSASAGTQAPNRAPQISGQPATSVPIGRWYSFTPVASDPDGNRLSFRIENRPTWLSFDGSTGRLWGYAGSSAQGEYVDIRIRVNDGYLIAALPSFSITVAAATPANRRPVISGNPPLTARVGQAYAFTPTASDPDGDRLNFRIANRPSWASFNVTTGALTGTPGPGAAGNYSNIIIQVDDGRAFAVLQPFSISIGGTSTANRAPVISGNPPTSGREGQAYGFTPTASDADGDRLSFTIANRPSWASFDPVSGTLSGTPGAGTNGTYSNISIQVSDAQASAALPAFSITVSQTTPGNRAPAISGSPALSGREGQAYGFTPTASDPDGDSLIFTIANRPSWSSFNPATGGLTGTPGPGTVGNYPNITIHVSDGRATATLPAFAINVQQTALGSATLSWNPPTTRTDGSPLTNLAGYRVRYGTSNGNYPNMIDINNAGLTTAVISQLTPATWYFVVSAYDSSGLESQGTAPVSKTIP